MRIFLADEFHELIAVRRNVRIAASQKQIADLQIERTTPCKEPLLVHLVVFFLSIEQTISAISTFRIAGVCNPDAEKTVLHIRQKLRMHIPQLL